MKKIAFFISCVNMLGGTEKATIETANRFAQEGNEVTIISLFKESVLNSFQFEIDSKINVVYIYENQKYGKLPLPLYFAGKKIYERKVNKVLNQVKPEYLLFPQTTMFFKPKYNIKLISIVHFSYEYFKNTKLAYNYLVKNIDNMEKVLFLTDECKNIFNSEQNTNKGESQKNINGLKAINSSKENLIVFVGRVDENQKQISHLVNILNKVNLFDYRVEIYGKGPDENILEKISNPNVKYMGPTNGVIGVYQRSKICLLTSKFEGTPISLVEAISTGNVIVSYNCSAGIRQIVVDEETGLIIEQDNQNEFIERLEKLLEDNQRVTKFNQNSIDHFKNEFSDDVIYQKWMKILK
jgi:amylovoran biosynthesis glycosyltransferase AmsD